MSCCTLWTATVAVTIQELGEWSSRAGGNSLAIVSLDTDSLVTEWYHERQAAASQARIEQKCRTTINTGLNHLIDISRRWS